MQPDVVPPPLAVPRRGRLLLSLLATFLAGGLIAGGGAYWWFKRHLDARALEPVHLAEAEERVLEAKLQALPEKTVHELHVQGALSLAYLHLLSLRRFRPLVLRAGQRAQAAEAPAVGV